jgi:hypothetical protein
MTSPSFWDSVLEADEKLLWTGRPKPLFHWRNWQLYCAAPMAAIGLLAAAWLFIFTTGSKGDMWLLILPALLVFIPARATWQQLKTYANTRYALTDKRAIFFHIVGEETRIKAYPLSRKTTPKRKLTLPESVHFLASGKGKSQALGFDFIETADELMQNLQRTA